MRINQRPVNRLYGGGTPVATDTGDLGIAGVGMTNAAGSPGSANIGGTLNGTARAMWFQSDDGVIPSWIDQLPASERTLDRVATLIRGDTNGATQACVGMAVGIATDNGGGSFDIDSYSLVDGGPSVGSPLINATFTRVEVELVTPLTLTAGKYVVIGLLSSGDLGRLYVRSTAKTGNTVRWREAEDFEPTTIPTWYSAADQSIFQLFWARTTAKKIELTVGAGEDIEYDTQTYAPSWRDIGHHIIFETIETATDDKLTISLAGIQSSNAGTDIGMLAESLGYELDLATGDETASFPWTATEAALSDYTTGDDFMGCVQIDADRTVSRAFLMNITDGDGGGSAVTDRTIQSINNMIAGDGTWGNEVTGYRDFDNSTTIDEDRYLTHITVTQDAGAPTVAKVIVSRKTWFGGVSSWACKSSPYGVQFVGEELDDSALSYFSAQPYIWPLGFSGGLLRTSPLGGSVNRGFWDKFGLAVASQNSAAASAVAGTHDAVDLKHSVFWLEAGGVINDFSLNTAGPGSNYAEEDVPGALSALGDIMSVAEQNNSQVVITEAVVHIKAGPAKINYLNEAVALFNECLPYLCEAHGAVCVRIFDLVCEYDNSLATYRLIESMQYAVDNFNHLNEAGNRRIAKAMVDAFEGRT